jgi:hypothetical protein
MGQAKNKGTREERIAAARQHKDGRKKQKETETRLFHEAVDAARKRFGVDFGLISGSEHRVVAVRFDEIVQLLARLMPEVAWKGEGPGFVFGAKEDKIPDAFTPEECAALGIDPPGTSYATAEEAKAAAERYQWQLDLKRARAEVAKLEEKEA